MKTTLRSVISAVQLGKTDEVLGTVFRKQIMSYGQWVNPNFWWDEELWIEFTESVADEMIANFNNKTYGKRISVPLNHTGDVKSNAGWVIKLEKGDGGLWAYLDIRNAEALDMLEKGLIGDVSMGLDWDYVDQKEGKHHGVTLFHVALVTDPYLNDMDDFAKADISELSRRFEEYAGTIGFATDNQSRSVIMMSKTKVEELKRMKFAKVPNSKDHDVEVTYTDEHGEEVTKTVKAGEEIEVPKEAEEAVSKQIADAAAPAADDDDDDKNDPEPEAGNDDDKDEPEGDPKPKDGEEDDPKPADPPKNEDKDAELARLRSEKADWLAKDKYNKLLAAGKITPAQKDQFLALAKATANTQVTLSKDAKKTFSITKGDTPSVLTLLSAILEAGPKLMELGEKGADGKVKVTLSAEQEAKLRKRGVNVETFKKRLESGEETLEEEN